jgi:hypothetical protein
MVWFSCGSDVVVMPPAAAASGGGNDGSTAEPSGKCAGKEGWTSVASPLQDLVVGRWTGTELILWGASSMSGFGFDTDTSTWRQIATIPSGDYGGPLWFSAVSAGRFFVWNHAKGGAYDWLADSWRPVPGMGGQLRNDFPSRAAIGTPTHVVYLGKTVWGGTANMTYEVADDVWRTMPEDSAPTALNPAAVWAKDELIVWGGWSAPRRATNTGGRFSFSNWTWKPMSSANAPDPAGHPVAAWTGNRVFVWGRGPGAVADGGLYDPVHDLWTPVSHKGAPQEEPAFAVWTGRQVIVIGADPRSRGIYTPTTDTWTSMMPAPRVFWQVVEWDGCRVLAYGGGRLYVYEPPP